MTRKEQIRNAYKLSGNLFTGKRKLHGWKEAGASASGNNGGKNGAGNAFLRKAGSK